MPVVAGLDDKGDGTYEPVIASYDYIGWKESSYFACAGTSQEFLYGVCESFFKEDMVSFTPLNFTLLTSMSNIYMIEPRWVVRSSVTITIGCLG